MPRGARCEPVNLFGDLEPVGDPDFTDWYSCYPRKREPSTAAKSYRKARKVYTAAQLLAARDALCAEGREDKYGPYPSTFLNRCLEDYVPSAPKREKPKPVCPKHGLETCRFYPGSGWVCA